MRIKNLRNKNVPKGFLTIVGAVHLVGVALYKDGWLKKPFQNKLPFRVGSLDDDPSTPSRDNHAWEYDDGIYKHIEQEIKIEPDEVEAANEIAAEFRAVTKAIKHRVLDGKVRLIFQNRTLGEHPATPEMMGLVRAQWPWLMDTGQVLLKREGQRDRLFTVFFEERNLVSPTRAVGINKQAKLDAATAVWLVQHMSALQKALNAEFLVKEGDDPVLPLNFELYISFARRLVIWKQKLIVSHEDEAFSDNTFRKWIWVPHKEDLPRKIHWRPTDETKELIQGLIELYVALLSANGDQEAQAIVSGVLADPKVQSSFRAYRK